MTTYRAAYIADDGSSTSGGLVLTSEEQQHLTDDDLIKAALEEAEKAGIESDGGEIVITTANRHEDMPKNGFDDIDAGDYANLKVQGTGI